MALRDGAQVQRCTRRPNRSGNSALFLFQLRPPRIKRIDVILGFFHLGTSALKPSGIAHDRGIFQRRPLGVQLPLCVGDPLFDGSELAGLQV